MTGAHVLDDAEVGALAGRSGAQRAAVLLAIDHLSSVPARPRAALLDEAHGWLVDCGMEDAGDVDDALVRELVRRQYEGGWSAFVVANVDLLELADGRGGVL